MGKQMWEPPMKSVLVTGASGVLGRVLVEQLGRAGYAVRAMSRNLPAQPDTTDWVRADLATGAGLDAALAGIDTIVHAASQPGKQAEQVDVLGTQRLIEQAQQAGVRHIIYISIVGIDQIPFTYYQYKLAAEQIICQSALPWSIQRATQFPELIDGLLRRAARLPVLLLPTDFKAQLIDTADVARRLTAVVQDGPAGRLPDIGGPAVQTLAELARSWLAARGMQQPIVHLPLPGAVAQGFRQGRNCCPDQRFGTLTWASWLARTYLPAAPTAS